MSDNFEDIKEHNLEQKRTLKVIEELNKEVINLESSAEYQMGTLIYALMHLDFDSSISKFKELVKGRRARKRGSHKNRFVPRINEVRKKDKVAVYTVLFGDYDELYDPMITDLHADYYIITDNKLEKESIWKQIQISKEDCNRIKKLSNSERNRLFKILGYKYFQKYDYSVYVDANIRLYGEIAPLVIYAENQYGIALFNHPLRSCVYQEFYACKLYKKAAPREIRRQRARYNRAGMPYNYGLAECNVIVRDNNNPKVEKLMQYWWDEYIKSETRRDQLAFAYVMWKEKIRFTDIGCLGESISSDGKFRLMNHLK